MKKNETKRLFSFYCSPCDHAWLEIKICRGVELQHSLCEYCKVKRQGSLVPKTDLTK